MKFTRMISAIDTHTEGMPTRVVTGGVGEIPGSTMNEKRAHFLSHMDDIRKLLVFEPRGHSAMYGAILQAPTRPDADFGILFILPSGSVPMCGHATIGAATALVETGAVLVTEPVTTIRFDTPAGLVVAEVTVNGGVAESVKIENVPSYCDRLDETVEVPGYGPVSYSLAFGGNFYAIVDTERLGIRFDIDNQQQIMNAGLAIMAAIDTKNPPRHPVIAGDDSCGQVQFLAPDSTPQLSRNAMAISPGWFDRSPCGTGTAARMAELWARGQLAVGEEMVNESLIGSRFTGRITGVTEVAGMPAIHSTVEGRAWITGIGQYVLDPSDPFPAGFEF